MDPSQFDRLVRALAQPASRRTTLAALLGSALAGGLAQTPAVAQGDASPKHGRCPAGKKDCHGRCIGKRQKCSKQGPPCRETGQPCQTNPECCTNQCAAGRCAPRLGCSPDGGACQQHSDCCAGNCFQQRCAAPPTSCSGQTCAADATGCCAGSGCCRPPANQCNTTGGQRGLCCAPNCAGRQCGPDGCGNRGTCGDCPSGQQCNPSTGQCQGPRVCSPDTCPTGCCANGVCQPGTTEQACGTNGQACVKCPGVQSTCQNGQCVCVPQCHGKACGPDGCGGSCGSCSACQTCTSAGQCQPSNYCADGTSLCGGVCNCLVKSDGAPFCSSGLGPCLNCKADGDAACAQVGAGYACVRVAGDHCTGCPDTEDFACLSPCGRAVTTSAGQGRRRIPRP